jgi:hypothetical protein
VAAVSGGDGDGDGEGSEVDSKASGLAIYSILFERFARVCVVHA